ncbi:MAG: PorT family protein [Bacteroidetes bacterium]|nr:MAG: PorT family protein [Bacteroidota bacterium]
MKVCIASLLALVLAAQTKAQFIKIGPKAGANLVKIDGNSFKDAYNLGYYAGAFAELRLSSKWYLQPELLFNETQLAKSSDFRDIYRNVLRPDSIGKIRLQTLSIPLTLNWRLANVFSLSAGTQFSLALDRNENLLRNAGNTFSRGEMALLGGANLNLGKFRINGRYAVGLQNLNDIDNRDEWRSQTVQLGVGFVF